jgi:hypothetical protein
MYEERRVRPLAPKSMRAGKMAVMMDTMIPVTEGIREFFSFQEKSSPKI